MKNKASRLDRVEKAIDAMGNLLMQQDQAVRWLVKELKDLKTKDIEVVDPNQLKFDFDAKEDKA